MTPDAIKKSFLLPLCLWALLPMLAGCGDGSQLPAASPDEAGAIALSGRLQFADGRPLAGAEIEIRTADGQPVATGSSQSDGAYQLLGQLPPEFVPQRLRVDARQRNAAEAPAVQGTAWTPEPVSPDALSLQLPLIALPDLQQAALSFDGRQARAADSSVIVTDLPEEMAGLWVARFDPDAQPEVFPGDFIDSSGEPLNSGGFLWLSAVDAQGREISEFDTDIGVRFELHPAQWVDLKDLVPANGQVDLPIYSFDASSGQWVYEPDADGGPRGVLVDAAGRPLTEAEGQAARAGSYQGRLYAAFATRHFSWWNLDYNPLQIIDPDANPEAELADYHSEPTDPDAAAVPTIFHPLDPLGQSVAFAGAWVDFETGPDGKDAFDDGVVRCGTDPLAIRVNNHVVDSTGVVLNVAIDRNGDGRYDGAGEWVVQNFLAQLPYRSTFIYEFPEVAWFAEPLRLTVTPGVIANYAGRGRFPLGETEDYHEGCAFPLSVGFADPTLPEAEILAEGADISCAADGQSPDSCRDLLPRGTELRLRARLGDVATPVRWLSAGQNPCAERPPSEVCSLRVDLAQTVHAHFPPPGTVSVFASRGGVISSLDGALNCGPNEVDCIAQFPLGSSVSVQATALPFFEFVGWRRDCAGASGSECSFELNAEQPRRNLRPEFRRLGFQVSVDILSGQGRVTTAGGEIDCTEQDPQPCTAVVTPGTTLQFLVEAPRDQIFNGWSGACGSAATVPECTRVINADTEVAVRFIDRAVSLAVSRSPGGTIRTADGKIDCFFGDEPRCLAGYRPGAQLELIAVPDPGQIFIGWGLDCADQGVQNPCRLDIEAGRRVLALFAPNNVDLGVQLLGAGLGVVRSEPAAIDCGAAEPVGGCQASVPRGASIVLRASAGQRSGFTGWGGACARFGLQPECPLQPEQALEVEASFARTAWQLSVGIDGNGRVRSEEPGIFCETRQGENCVADFSPGTVELLASPEPGFAFVGWSGACSGTDAICRLSLAQDSEVGARFLPTEGLIQVQIDGPGTVRSQPPGIECQPDGSVAHCAASFAPGTRVQLEQTAGPEHVFAGWGRDCTSFATQRRCPLTAGGRQGASVRFVPARALSNLEVRVEGQARVTATVFDPVFGSSISESERIDCGPLSELMRCEAQFDRPKRVILSLAVAPDFEFSHWLGPCSGDPQRPSCDFLMTEDRQITAVIRPKSLYTARVSVDGEGTVVSEPAAIDCDASGLSGPCVAQFLVGEREPPPQLILRPVAPPTHEHRAWGGDCSHRAAGQLCLLDITRDYTVSAEFVVRQNRLLAFATGPGRVVSDPAGIRCIGGAAPSDCRFEFPATQTVELRAIADPGARFVGWNNDCFGVTENRCSLEMRQRRRAGASFELLQYPVQLSVDGPGQVSSLPAGLACDGTDRDSDCRHDFSHGTELQLQATAQAGHRLARWGGACAAAGTASTCTVTLGGALQASAEFVPLTQALELTVTGAGEVVSSPAGIRCDGEDAGSDCQQGYDFGTAVELSANARAGQRFLGWGGDCAGTPADQACALTMTQDRSVTASFESNPILTLVVSGAAGQVGDGGKLICNAGETCQETYAPGSVLSLSGAGAGRLQWGGACSGVPDDEVCHLIMDRSRSATAVFVGK